MYQMLAGQSPFRASSAADLYRLIIQTPPLPLEELCPKVDRALASVVMRCLEKDAADRFPGGIAAREITAKNEMLAHANSGIYAKGSRMHLGPVHTLPGATGWER